jgi:hypothetical protein
MKSQRNPEFDEIIPELAEAVPALRGLRLEQIATPLGGLSNSNYHLDLPDGALVLRVPRSNPGPFRIDRQEEMEAACFAGMIGIGPPVLYANPHGVMLTRFVGEAEPMSIEAYRPDPGAVQRTAYVVAGSIARIIVSSAPRADRGRPCLDQRDCGCTHPPADLVSCRGHGTAIEPLKEQSPLRDSPRCLAGADTHANLVASA